MILPLHSPIRVAEDWSMVDNLSRGRAGLALATGFSPVDFAINPAGWADRRRRTFDAVGTIRELWEGAPVFVEDGLGNNVEVELHPQPVRSELPLWLTCTKNPETFEMAGRLGCNVLTALIDMTNEELEEKLALYYKTLEEHGHDREDVVVTLMLHTFIGTDLDEVRETVRPAFTEYLRSFFTVIDSQKKNLAPGAGVRDISDADQDELIGFAFDKYFGRGALLGTPDSCAAVVDRFHGMGVQEIACLIDFGVEEGLVMESLGQLDELRRRYA